MRKHNFCAGPCTLPQSVFKEAAAAVENYNNSGLSILEISHRSDAFVAIMEEARALALEMADLQNKDYEALFLHGGASMQFLMVAYNFLQKKAAYLDTGVWSSKAIKEGELFGEAIKVASSKDENYNYVPKNYSIPEVDYFHCTSNNTIYGTQLKEFPQIGIPMICDMSSDIFSKKIDYNQFDLIYAGAQKNIGTTGTALVLIKKELLKKIKPNVPSMLSYQTHIERKSMFNTPPVYAIYVALLNLRWLEKQGGISATESKNRKKAALIYKEIDRNPLFYGFAKKEDRSMMNATFFLKDESLSDKFNDLWQKAEINGLEGHRTIGGYRASMYNALSIESVELLVQTMQELEKNI
ncbi:3-phosphoserine/phosphohydroxythreonine transaminase [Haloflavibacter putidus]|uniref:Phosphoserine aminotransferase n=1 Tax=Haloflavibacter putidus TaxID=2576776 RepID=A0A507ZQY2_9FLAO|nr:3-phosphoserine/phosphohydroxythreonine transaminase [Haloflavibacter putidus]TQD40166.1 3-phosphoserine/phosphohydroxythreonine transaminase [Haloflavibacter putidus]